jgi:hypothetical protein
MRSASTKFWASDATSTPEPALSDVRSRCAAALFAACMSAAVELPLVLLTELVAMAVFGALTPYQYCESARSQKSLVLLLINVCN